jgi:hypothetical protein
MFEWILPDGKRLGDATKSDADHAIAVSEARAAVDLALCEVLEVFKQDRAAGISKLYELYERFEVWPPLDATGAQ